jgi:hypothetical protein
VKRVFAVVLGIVICAGASTMIVNAKSDLVRQAQAKRAADAAYRDGLFLGQLDAAQGRTRHACVGRWSESSDRTSFAAGYEDGYSKAEE